MALIKLLHVNGWTDRHGRKRIYFRRPGCKAIPLPGPVGSPAFMEAYNSALVSTEPLPKVGLGTAKAGTFAALALSYLNSGKFRDKRPETQRTERGIIDGLVAKHGDKLQVGLRQEHVQAMIDAKTDRPSAARKLLAVIRAVMSHAVTIRQRKDNPAIGVTRRKIRTPGYRTWEEVEIAAYRARHPLGTRARLAIELLVNTGQRRGDVIRMGRQHLRDGVLYVRQEKTGAEVFVPILPPLQAALNALPASNMTFLVTTHGKPYTAAGFGNWFRECCNEAGLKGLSAHGLRKATCRRLAEAGRSASEIAAITGHRTLRMVQRYTEAADRRRMAKAAMEGMYECFGEQPRTSDLQTPVTDLQTGNQGLEKKGA
jgi:integrase